MLLLAVLVLPAPQAARGGGEDNIPPLRRSLADVSLGDGLERVRRIYPPAQEWPAISYPKTGVTRYRVERGGAKIFPARVHTLYLGFKRGRLVEIEVVYDKRQSRAQSVEKLAGEYALIYGEAKRSAERFWWSDGKTVLRVFPAEISIVEGGARAVTWLTAAQVFERGLVGRGE